MLLTVVLIVVLWSAGPPVLLAGRGGRQQDGQREATRACLAVLRQPGQRGSRGRRPERPALLQAEPQGVRRAPAPRRAPRLAAPRRHAQPRGPDARRPARLLRSASRAATLLENLQYREKSGNYFFGQGSQGKPGKVREFCQNWSQFRNFVGYRHTFSSENRYIVRQRSFFTFLNL